MITDSRAVVDLVKQISTSADFEIEASGITLIKGTPLLAGAAMAFSSITVVGNANRLRAFKPRLSTKGSQSI